MASFGATLRDDLNNLDIVADGSVMKITDHSNYDTNTEVGHAQGNFSDFRKIIITKPDNTLYVFSSLGDGDELITPASVSILPILTTYNYSGDGVYKVCLYTVPTWVDTVSYTTIGQHCVFYNERLWKALQNNLNVEPGTDPTVWQEISFIDLSNKYVYCGQIAVYCDIITCYMYLVKDVVCGVKGLHCADDICKNPLFQSLAKLDVIIESIPVLVDIQDWGSISHLINFGKQICCCINN